MGEHTNIQWCDYTQNFWLGCTKVSAGCKNCYAETLDRNRYSKTLDGGTKAAPVSHWGPGALRHRTSEANWRKPYAWNRAAGNMGFRPRVFCSSLADWLDNEVPAQLLAEALEVVWRCSDLNWLMLTKRPELWSNRIAAARRSAEFFPPDFQEWLAQWSRGTPPDNVWVGTSVENQEWADRRIPELLKIPAKIRFLSCEPLLGLIVVPLRQWQGIQWAIIGGESGPGARTCDINWVYSLVSQAKMVGAAPFVKQLGSAPVHHVDRPRTNDNFAYSNPKWKEPMKLKDKKGGDMAEWPADLRFRKFPA